MRVLSWNLNGIRARETELLELFGKEQPDVVCLQEIKATTEQLSPALYGLTGLTDYHSLWHGNPKGYSGVSVHLKKTRFPTAPDLWRAQLVPTCSLGAPETLFKLVVCEIGGASEGGRRFVWDAAGNLFKVGGDGKANGKVVVPLNDANPTLGTLDPPHSPRDRRPRLDVRFGVDENRWLIATVSDLLTSRTLLDRQPVVRLL